VGRILAGLDQSELARLAKVHITTVVRLEAFDAQTMRGQSGTITAVVNALAKAGIELRENGSIFPRPKGKADFKATGIFSTVQGGGKLRTDITTTAASHWHGEASYFPPDASPPR
jgi:hypothetical protein